MQRAVFKLWFVCVVAGASFFITSQAWADTTDDSTITSETAITNPTTTPDVSVPTANLFLRYQDRIIYNGTINLTTTSYHDAINDKDYDLASGTVFSALVLAQKQSNGAFSITDAQYNSAYNSFYLACIGFASSTSPSSTENACYNWNYAVNGNYPSIGMDTYNLSGNETAYIYFSTPWQLTASSSSLPIDTTTTFETWRYQYDNLANPWVHDANDLVDISIPNPNPPNSWDTTITVTTTPTDADGYAIFSFPATGTYYAKIVSTDWSKWSNPITINVVEATDTSLEQATTTISTSTDPGDSPGSGTGPDQNPTSTTQSSSVGQGTINDAVQKIINFLKSKQAADGSILDLGTSDWAAVAFGSNGIYASSIKNTSSSLYDYLYNAQVDSASDPLNLCTGYSRHILGLLAGGVGKNDDKITALKNKINDECFANGVIGQAGINDDVFVLLSMLAAGDDINNQIVQTAINTITSDQQISGAFTWNGWASADITGAAINALNYAQNNGAVVDNSVYQKAENYLKSTQLADGGWGFSASDALTTSWAMYGINALGENQQQWTNTQNKNPWSFLTDNLSTDGYYQTSFSSDGVDWFATKHAVPALLGKSWPIILDPISQVSSPSGQDPDQLAIIPSSTPSSTTAIATTTPELQTEQNGQTTTSVIESPDLVGAKQSPGLVVSAKGLPRTPRRSLSETGRSLPFAPPDNEITTVTTATISGINAPAPDKTEEILDQIPLDSPTRKLAKKILEISGGSAIALGLFLGFKFIKGVV